MFLREMVPVDRDVIESPCDRAAVPESGGCHAQQHRALHSPKTPSQPAPPSQCEGWRWSAAAARGSTPPVLRQGHRSMAQRYEG